MPEREPDPMAELVSRTFAISLDPSTGCITSLRNPQDPYKTNFVIGPKDVPEFDIEDSRWVGDLHFAIASDHIPGVQTMRTGVSGDIRSTDWSASSFVTCYTGHSANAQGIKSINLQQTFSLDTSPELREQLKWEVRVTNTENYDIELQDFGMSLLMNSYWKGDQTGIYEQNVSRHSFIGQHGSYIYWQRPNGVAPYLLLVPQGDTRLEYKDKTRARENAPCEEIHPKWEGACEFFVHSKNVACTRNAFSGSYLPPSSQTLAPHETATFSFAFLWAADYCDLRNVLFETGGLDAVSLPGMVIPTDLEVHLALRAKGGVRKLELSSKLGSVICKSTSGDYELWRIRFASLGPNQVIVRYSDSHESVLQYYAIEPIERLISLHSAFLVDHQLARSTRGYNGAFLQWDMSKQKLVTWDDYPGGGWKEWMAGGSDDLGLAPAAFLASKNLVCPSQKEISAIEFYVDNFLLGYLQNVTKPDGERTWQVYRWFDGQDVEPVDKGIWRAYNYTHIANTYFDLYRIGKTYSHIRLSKSPIQFLEFCFHTLNALFHKIPLPNPIGNAAYEMGLMGESTYPDILRALEEEGLTSQSRQLRAALDDKFEHFKGQRYPFASEMSIDTTGFESCYTLSTLFGHDSLARKVQNASMGCRGLQPVWYYYGSDNRSMGESWWNLGYETQLGAMQQLEYLIAKSNTEMPDQADMIRSTYGAYLAGWANINSGQIHPHPRNIGAAAWVYQSERGVTEFDFMDNFDGWWAWSGEADLGFWGATRAASVVVTRDPVVGLYAFGAMITMEEGSRFAFLPRDGVRNRFCLLNLDNISVRLFGTQYTKAFVDLKARTISLSIEGVSQGGARVHVENWLDGPAVVKINDARTGETVERVGRSEFRIHGVSARPLSLEIR